jgi:hypothetical protein
LFDNFDERMEHHMTHIIIYAVSLGLCGMTWITLALSDHVLRERDEKWPMRSAFPHRRHTPVATRKNNLTTQRGHRQMGYIHEESGSYFSAR